MNNIKIIIMILALLCLYQTAKSQQISLRVDNLTVKQSMEMLTRQTGYSFVYEASDVDTGKILSFSLSDRPIGEAIRLILQGQNLSFEIVDKNIVVKRIPRQVVGTSQGFTVRGMVVDKNELPIVGVAVTVQGTTTGTTTDTNGDYIIPAQRGETLRFSFMGYEEQVITVGGRTTINVQLNEEVVAMDEVVVVGYGTQRRGNLTGSVSVVNSNKLTVAPVGNVTNTLAGQLPGLVAKQTGGQPGTNNTSLSIRGFANALVIVDGVESAFHNIDASQIETISILKDGAASIYGARGGNGVILVTTKRGADRKTEIDINSSFTMQGSTKILRPTNSGQRAELANEAHLHQGLPEADIPFTSEEIRKYYDGSDPGYLNSDWFGAVIRPWAPQQNHNASVRGGTEKVKYYAFLGYNDQQTIIRNHGGSFSRYNIQSNTDIKLSPRVNLSIDLSAIYEDSEFPYYDMFGGSELWNTLYDTEPRYPIHLPDPEKMSYGGTPKGSALYVSSMELSGYRRNKRRTLRSGVSLTYDFKNVPGLKAKAFINYNDTNAYAKHFGKQQAAFTYNPQSSSYTQVLNTPDPTALYEYLYRDNTTTQQYSLAYEDNFGGHNISAMVLYELTGYNYNDFGTSRNGFMAGNIDQLFAGNVQTANNWGWAQELGRASWVGRINYRFKDRYLVETIFRADASAKYSPKERWGFFPSVSLGWVMSEEKFMRDIGFIDNIKLRGSIGQSGDDSCIDFQYLTGYGFDGTYVVDGEIKQVIYPTGLANPFLTWEKMTIYNGGLDFSLLRRKIYGTVEGFYRLRDGIPATRTNSLPSTFGAKLPQENLNSIGDRGFELVLGSTGRMGNLIYDVNGNISWSRAKWVKYDEPEYADPDERRLYSQSGKWTDRRIGYVSDGLFTSQQEIDNLAYEYKDLNGNSTLRPGDVKYSDANNDDVLDWRDMQEIGNGTIPHWMYGFNISLRYRNFDFSTLFQGAFGYSTRIDLSTSNTSLMFENRWTENNNDPRSIVARWGGSPSNGWNSDYLIKRSSYLRMRNAAVGYNFQGNILSKAGVTKLRVYVAATNLFTLTNLKKFGVDPEMPDGNGPTNVPVNVVQFYPLQRTISFGVNLSF